VRFLDYPFSVTPPAVRPVYSVRSNRTLLSGLAPRLLPALFSSRDRSAPADLSFLDGRNVPLIWRLHLVSLPRNLWWPRNRPPSRPAVGCLFLPLLSPVQSFLMSEPALLEDSKSFFSHPDSFPFFFFFFIFFFVDIIISRSGCPARHARMWRTPRSRFLHLILLI